MNTIYGISLLMALFCCWGFKPQFSNAQLQAHNLDMSTLKQVIPVEAKEFYESLDTTDKEVLYRVLNKSSQYSSIGEVLSDVRGNSTQLYDKLVSIVLQTRGVVEKLSPEARTYVEQTIQRLHKEITSNLNFGLLKTEANLAVQNFRKLKKATRLELREAFPIVATVIDNSIFQMLAGGLLGISNDDSTDNLSDDEITPLPPTSKDFPTPSNLKEKSDNNNDDIEEKMLNQQFALTKMKSNQYEMNDFKTHLIYEFELPNSLVGLIIGVGGKTIKELCVRTNVKMLISPHHTPAKYKTHQICSVEGKRENINKCLHLIKGRFPKERFSDLNLKPVLPPSILPLNPVHQTPTQLTLAVGVPCEVYVSATVDAGHFFTQLPTHPSFSSLQLLDYYMLTVYSTQPNTIPELSKPYTAGCICAAPAYNGWFRAIVLYYYGEQDEALVRYVDYGGYARLPRADLRQIRADFLSLPLQAIECSLAHVQPIDGTSHWSDEANSIFQKLCSAKIIQAELIGTNKHDNLPAVELHVVDENKKMLRVDQVLLENGLAKPADPTRIVKPTSKKSLNASGDASTNEHKCNYRKGAGKSIKKEA